MVLDFPVPLRPAALTMHLRAIDYHFRRFSECCVVWVHLIHDTSDSGEVLCLHLDQCVSGVKFPALKRLNVEPLYISGNTHIRAHEMEEGEVAPVRLVRKARKPFLELLFEISKSCRGKLWFQFPPRHLRLQCKIKY